MQDSDILNLFFEWGQLRRIHHEGWKVIGVTHPESVAEHNLRAAQIGFVLAKLENYPNPYEVCTMVVFHDIGEARIGDIHKLAARYIKADEEGATREQLAPLKEIGEHIFQLWSQVEYPNNRAGAIAKDADLLEQAVMAKEYIDRGYEAARHWIDNIEKALQTETAKRLLETLKRTKSYEWCLGKKGD